MKRLYLLLPAIAAYPLSAQISETAEEMQARITELESLVSILQSKLVEVDLLNFILLGITGSVFLIIFLAMNFSFRRRIYRELNAVKRQLMGSSRDNILKIMPEDEGQIAREIEKIDEYNMKMSRLAVSEKEYQPSDWLIRGIDLFYRQSYDESLKAYDQALRKGGSAVEIHYGRGTVLNLLDRKEEAVDAFREALSIDPRSAESWCSLGIALEELNRNEEAVEAFGKAVEINPDYTKAYRKLGMDLRKLERKEEAVQAYSRMGDTLLRMGREEEAVEAYSNMAIDLIKLGPEEDGSVSGHGNIDLESLEREQEALDSYYAMGSKFSELGRNDEALEAYEEILKIKPEDREARFCKARALARLGNYREAGDSLMELVEMAPDHVKAWYLLGKVQEKLGHDSEAELAFKTVKKLKPDHPDTYQKLAAFYADRGKSGEALVNLEKFLELNRGEAGKVIEKINGFEILKKEPGYLDLINKYRGGAPH